MDPETLNEFKDRQAKMQSIQSSIQSGDFKSGYGLYFSIYAVVCSNRVSFPHRISAMLDEGKPAASGVSKAQSSATPRSKGKGKRR